MLLQTHNLITLPIDRARAWPLTVADLGGSSSVSGSKEGADEGGVLRQEQARMKQVLEDGGGFGGCQQALRGVVVRRRRQRRNGGVAVK